MLSWLIQLPATLACWLIKAYQRLAPRLIRDTCLFEPSCSEYALLVIRHRGVIEGLPLIVGRLSRCRPPNGGTDYPELRPASDTPDIEDSM